MSEDIRGVRERVTQELRKTEATQSEAGVSGLAVHGDPSVHGQASPAGGRGAGITWVRAMDVLQGQGTRLADAHARGQENLVRRMRHGMAAAVSRRGVARQAAVLPPVTGFGQPAPASSSPVVGR